MNEMQKLLTEHPRVYVDRRGDYELDDGERVPTRHHGFLTEEEWREADAAVERAAEFRMRTFRTFVASGLQLNCQDLSDGTDPRHAELSGLKRSFTSHQCVVDLKWSSDYTPMETSARRVGEAVEDALLAAMIDAAGAFDVHDPAAPEWLGVELVKDVLRAKPILQKSRMFGPYLLLHGLGWDRFLDDDYRASSIPPSVTVRRRVREVEGLIDVRVASTKALGESGMLLFQATADVARVVVELAPTLFQWDDAGQFRVVAKITPQVRNRAGLLSGRIA